MKNDEELNAVNEIGAEDSDEAQNLYEHFRFEVDKGQSQLELTST